MRRFMTLVTIALLLAMGGAATAQDSLNVRLVGMLSGGGEANDVATWAERAFVASGMGLRIVDISEPSAPELVGSLTSPGCCYGIAVQGHMVYLGSPDTGLRIIDCSEPTAPTEVGFYHPTPSAFDGVAVDGDLVYIADFASGLRIVDVSDPTHPAQVGYLDTPGQPVGVTIDGPIAYVSDFNQGLRIINVSDPAQPEELGFIDTPGAATRVSLLANIAFVADQRGGLRIVNVGTLAGPREIAHIETNGSTFAVDAISWPYAAVADGLGGVRVFNIQAVEAPVDVGYYELPGGAVGVEFVSPNRWVAVGEDHLGIYEYAPPSQSSPPQDRTASSFLLHDAYPNPFNANTTIEFSLPNRMQVALDVFNLLGERVATLVNDNLAGGEHRVNFDASSLASGVYVYRLQSAEFEQTRKLVLLK